MNADQGIFSRTETVSNSSILTPPSDPDSMLDSMRPSSEPLHGRVGTEDPFTGRAESDPTKPPSARNRSQSPRPLRSSQHNRLSQEDHPYPRQANPAFDNNTSEEKPPQQQDEEENIYSNDDGLLQPADNTAIVALITEMGDEPHLSANGIRRTSLAKRQRILPSRDLSLEPSQDQARTNSDNCSDDKLISTEAELDEDDWRPCPTKRKRPSSSYVGPTQRKRKQHLQEGSTQQGRKFSPQGHCWKPRSRFNHGSRVVPGCSGNSQLPSPPRSALEAMDMEIPSDCGALGESSKRIQPLLTEVTFRPHSPNYYSFTAFIQDDRDEPEFSFGQFSRLIECVGHGGNIEDFTIKPLKQHSFLVTGFSRHMSSSPSQSGRTVGSTTNAGRVPLGARRTRLGKGGSASTFASQRRETSSSVVDYGFSDGSSEDELGRSDTRNCSQWSASSSSDDDGFGDGDLNPGSDGTAYSSEDSVGRSDKKKFSEWSPLDKQRLSAYKKEGKPWEWIFSRFPGRTAGAVRTRWSTMQPKVK